MTQANSFLRMPQQSADKQISMAFLRSPTLRHTRLKSCLVFRYRMHGPGVYSLALWRYSQLRWVQNKVSSVLYSTMENGNRPHSTLPLPTFSNPTTLLSDNGGEGITSIIQNSKWQPFPKYIILLFWYWSVLIALNELKRIQIPYQWGPCVC